jgi:hypothetical protein
MAVSLALSLAPCSYLCYIGDPVKAKEFIAKIAAHIAGDKTVEPGP